MIIKIAISFIEQRLEPENVLKKHSPAAKDPCDLQVAFCTTSVCLTFFNPKIRMKRGLNSLSCCEDRMS